MNTRLKALILFLALAAIVIPGCTFSVEAERITPTISAALVATTVAKTLQAVITNTPQPSSTPEFVLATATAPPTVTPLPAPTRIRFDTGATTGLVGGDIQPGQVLKYVVGASAWQPLIVSVYSDFGDVTVSVRGLQDGADLLTAGRKLTWWQTMLNVTQDYLIEVHAGENTEQFTLSVTTPARVTFEQNSISTQRSGSTPGGLIVAYIIRASIDQRMKLQLDAANNNAALAVYGFQDGQIYLRSAAQQTFFRLTLPVTQDYVIQVIPHAGMDVSYDLTIEVR